MEVLKFMSYHDYLVAVIKQNKNVYGYKASLAYAAGCQRPYLSQVLTRSAHFTTEHAMGLSKFWNFNSQETLYFLSLVCHERAGTKDLKDFYENAMKRVRIEAENLSKRFGQTDQVPEHQSIYYSDWIYGAVHMLTTISKFRTVSSLAMRLGVPEQLIERTLNTLKKINLVVQEGKKWSPSNKTLHLSKDSIFTTLNHQNWRARAMIDSTLGNQKGIHYSAAFSLSLKDFERLRFMLLEFIDQTREIAIQSNEEDVVAFTCDLFQI